jgi:lipopolysaccharide/colanic/teichoic acid biosynthesis glycosyltransferase
MLIYPFIKRLVDLGLAAVLLVLFLPIWLVVPILIKRDTPGPVFFRHRRVGKNGVEFEMFKFRSMIADAHDYLHHRDPDLLKKFKDSDWKLANDPRITKIGKVLRSTSVDEFPQLLNVLMGQMSIVGPRAYMKQELEEQTNRFPQTKPHLKYIYRVKPGLTGPWQVSGRNDVPFTKRTQLDAEYAKTLSFKNDFQIMLKTPQAMFSKW